MNDTNVSEAQGALAIIDCDSPPEVVAAAIQRVEAIKDIARELGEMMNETLTEWLADGRSLEIGTKRYYLGKTVTKKAIKNGPALEALFAATNGDLEEVASCISGGASAWKYAKASQILGDKYTEHFIETVKMSPKGEAVKSVKAVDTRFQQ